MSDEERTRRRVCGGSRGRDVALWTIRIKARVEHRLIEEDIRGVSVVVRRRTVTLSGMSGFDDSLRYTIAVRLYNDTLFWNYAIQVDPPIHVIVRYGRVTLTGVVLSDVERRKAEVIARTVFGVLSVENHLRLERSTSSQGERK